MKTYLFLIFIVLLSSCSTTVWQLQTECESNTEEVFKHISVALFQENFIIKESNVSLGYLIAEHSLGKSGFLNREVVIRYWIFQVNNEKILAKAKEVYTSYDDNGSISDVKEKYYNDETSIKDTWYWTVRNKLENICMNKVYFYKSESN
ncbi:MAG TPA: hypothetical protein PKY56_04920 [Candidatus Kapabacteria bacterium]|nr:hypothetical protein [Candidatus Kapabacteria bacterium]HPO62264.1 hypothetical protein [Candidatus Kapabacteria bacterium]